MEPYVVAADVYSVAPHVGRGGWTWYTGSAGWLYRLGIEAILGLRRSGDELRITPCIPPQRESYQMTVRHGTAVYDIQVHNPSGVSQGAAQVTLDGEQLAEKRILLHDDGGDHAVTVRVRSQQ